MFVQNAFGVIKLDSSIGNTSIRLVCHLTAQMNHTKIASSVIASICLFAIGLLEVLADSGALPKDFFTSRDREYWALQRVHRLKPPAVEFSKWVRNPIDSFVLSRPGLGRTAAYARRG